MEQYTFQIDLDVCLITLEQLSSSKRLSEMCVSISDHPNKEAAHEERVPVWPCLSGHLSPVDATRSSGEALHHVRPDY